MLNTYLLSNRESQREPHLLNLSVGVQDCFQLPSEGSWMVKEGTSKLRVQTLGLHLSVFSP